nr:gustatory receptor [Fopius arisanus]
MAAAVAILIWIFYILSCKKLIFFSNKIMKADAIVRDFRADYKLESMRNSLGICATIYVILFSLFIYTEYFSFVEPIPGFIWFSMFCTPTFVIIFFLIQYCLAVKLMSQRMKALNNTILRAIDTTALPPSTMMQSHPDSEIMRTFEIWKNAHDELYEGSTIMANFYSFPILFVMGYVCYAVIFNTFYLGKALRKLHNREAIHWFLNDFVWILILAMPTVTLMLEIEKFLSEAKGKAAVCRKLAVRFTSNRLFRRQVNMYSHELLHENINFTASGFFSLNGNVLHSIFATIVTYLVIIFQFDNIYRQ